MATMPPERSHWMKELRNGQKLADFMPEVKKLSDQDKKDLDEWSKQELGL